MFNLLKHLGWKKIISAEAFPFIVAMLVAQMFYKFGSFVFECCAFIATWYLLSWLMSQANLFTRKTTR